MSLFPQLLLDTHDELIVDLFAGGGGASVGIEMATGRQVDYAINHDPEAVALHRANHPQTEHLVSDVWEVDPREVAGDRPVGLLWASPDCTDHSKAKGGKPIRDTKRRALAWVVKRWAGQVRPRVILLENVEEFVDWGPLVGPPGELRRDPERKGRTFRRWVSQLEDLGYEVEWKELRACDYGTRTIRKRLFIVGRCDGEPIVWPEPTHGPGARRKYGTAAECIDWDYPILSIFATSEEAKAWGRARRKEGWRIGTPRRPLADATLRRIARGVVRYVVEAADPFVVYLQQGGADRSLREPLHTVTASPKDCNLVVAPTLVPRYGERDGQEPRTRDIQEPLPAVVPTGNGASLVAAFLAKHYGGNETPGWPLDEAMSTVTSQDHHGVVAASLTKLRGTSSDADPGDPLHTISAGGTHHGVIAAHLTHYQTNEADGNGTPASPARTILSKRKAGLVYAFLQKYYGQGVGQEVDAPAPTVTTKDRMGLVTVEVDGEPHVIVDIAMRMLQPRELYRAQGFPDSYVIDRGPDGERLTKTAQVRMVGNSVCPQVAAALVRANVPALIARDEVLQEAMSA